MNFYECSCLNGKGIQIHIQSAETRVYIFKKQRKLYLIPQTYTYLLKKGVKNTIWSNSEHWDEIGFVPFPEELYIKPEISTLSNIFLFIYAPFCKV